MTKYMDISETIPEKLNVKEDLPDEYLEPSDEPGHLEKFVYNTFTDGKKLTRRSMVYLPYAYTSKRKYDVVYLMHGRGGSFRTWLGKPEEPRPFKNILDNMIENEDIRPIIVVAPELSYDLGSCEIEERDELSDNEVIQGTAYEIVKELIPLIDIRYSTYKKDRNHRCFAGFSMGGNMAWHMLEEYTDQFYYYIPMSMAPYFDSEGYSQAKSDSAVKRISTKLASSGYGPDDYKVYVASGDADHKSMASYMIVKDLVDQTDNFIYADAGFNTGNIFFNLWPDRFHKYTQSFPYMYNGLKKFFK